MRPADALPKRGRGKGLILHPARRPPRHPPPPQRAGAAADDGIAARSRGILQGAVRTHRAGAAGSGGSVRFRATLRPLGKFLPNCLPYSTTYCALQPTALRKLLADSLLARDLTDPPGV